MFNYTNVHFKKAFQHRLVFRKFFPTYPQLLFCCLCKISHFFKIHNDVLLHVVNHTVWPRSVGQFCKVTYYIKWVKISWTYRQTHQNIETDSNTVCPSILDPIFIVTYYIEQVKSSWTDSTFCTNGQTQQNIETDSNTVCPRSLAPIFIATYYNLQYLLFKQTDIAEFRSRL